MAETVMDRIEAQAARPIHHISRVTSAVADAFEDGLGAAKRIGKRGSEAAEELMDDTVQRIKRHPIETVMIAFGAGVMVGGFISWLARRK